MIHVHTGGGWHTATAFVRQGGAWKRAGQTAVRANGVWREVGVSVLTAVANPTSILGSRVGPGEVSMGPTTCAVTGGVAPYSYIWQRAGYGGIGATASSAATTAFAGGAGAVGTYTAQFTCVVTDALGQSAVSNAVNVSFTINLS